MSAVTQRSSYHGWLPQNPEVHAKFLRTHVSPYAPTAAVQAPDPIAATKELGDLVKKFFEAIDEDMKAKFDLIFLQVNKDKTWAPLEEDFRVHDLEHLRKALTSAISGPPSVYIVEREDDPKKAIGEPIGIPIYLVLDLLINTDAAHDLFRMPNFNSAMQKLLQGWGDYLKDKEAGSNSSLNTSETGWFGPYGLSVLEQGLKRLTFQQTYNVDPQEAQKTYLSWDDFFIRDIYDIDRLRPVTQAPGLHLLYNSCESTSVRTAHNVQLHDTFWLKTQNYSLWDMLGGNNPNSLSGCAQQFVGGSIYQAFLAPQDYHHWHSPIEGTVVHTAVIPGTYYAALPDDGAPEGDQHLRPGDPHGALMRSQPWLSIAAARGIVIIKPTETVPPSPIELVCVIAIGMVEVSTIDIRVSTDGVKWPNKLAAGDELGMFHFGGSSHTVIVKPRDGYEVVYEDENDIPIVPNQHRWVRSIIGRVTAKA